MTSPFSGLRERRALPTAGLACALVLTTLSSSAPARAADIESRLVSASLAVGTKDSDNQICTQSGGALADSQLVSGDGKKVTTKHSTVRTLGAGLSDPDDNQTFTLRSSGTASRNDRAGLPRSFTFDSQVFASGEYSKGAKSDCRSTVRSYSYLTLDSTLPPGFVTLRMEVTGEAQGYFGVSGGAGDPGVIVYGNSPGHVDYTVFVKGGDYRLDLDAETFLVRPSAASTTTSKSGRVTVRGSYVGLGEATSRSTGKARRYLALGAQRSCSANTIAARVTGNAARARTISKLVIKVNGKRAARMRDPRPGSALSLKAPPSAKTATVVASVTTERKGGQATATVSRSYAACSG